MNEVIIRVLLAYYFCFWAFNVIAYIGISLGLYRWLKFVKGMDAESIVRVSLKITAGFAIARLMAGTIGIGLYELEQLSSIGTILILGVTSLLLNTSFIMTEGWFLNREAQAVFALPEPKQATVKEAINTFDKLRRAANA